MLKLHMYQLCNLTKITSKRYFSQNVAVDRSKTIYSVLKPYIDFDERLENIEKLEKSIKLRGLDIKLTALTSLWKHYKNVGEDILKLEKERFRIVDDLEKIEHTGNADKIKALKFAGINIREDLKKLKIVLTQLEEQIFPRVLQLPNDVIEPSDKVIFSTEIPQTNVVDHIEIGKSLKVLEYISSRSYFLKGDAAIFELAVSNEVTKLFVNNNFIRFSNPDFTRNSIVKYLHFEDVQSLLSLEKHRDDDDVDQLHLHGGASLFPFCCFHTKSISDIASVPVQYVTKGRHYAQNNQPGLYGVWQNTSVQIFIGTDEENIEEQLNRIVKLLINYYTTFRIPLRVVHSPIETLAHSEKLHISFQTYSSYYKQYFEIGNISLYGDYISKRLRIYYSNKKENKFMQIFSGTVLKVPPLLASILEYKQDCVVKNYV